MCTNIVELWIVLGIRNCSETMDCRAQCGACCTAPSITSPIPGMPHGKPAGVACVQLDAQLRCRLFGKPERPAFCASLRPGPEMCGRSREEAMMMLAELERMTQPPPPNRIVPV